MKMRLLGLLAGVAAVALTVTAVALSKNKKTEQVQEQVMFTDGGCYAPLDDELDESTFGY